MQVRVNQTSFSIGTHDAFLKFVHNGIYATLSPYKVGHSFWLTFKDMGCPFIQFRDPQLQSFTPFDLKD